MADILHLKACVLWVGGSIPEMEAVRSSVGKHNADFISLSNNTETRRWLHTHEDRIAMTSIVTNRFRAEDGGDLAAENLITLLRGLTYWNSIRVMVFCAQTDTVLHLQSNLTRVTSNLSEVIKFVLEHSRTAGVGLTTTFRSVSDSNELDTRVRQVETYLRVLRKLVNDTKSDLDDETLQDLRRRAIASKASMLRWLSMNGAHPDAARIDSTIRSIEESENAYATAVANRGGGSVSCSLYFRVRERTTLIPGVENATMVTNAKSRKVMLLVDKNRWAVWSKDGKDMLGSQKYEDTVELRIGRAEIAVAWRHTETGRVYGWCVAGKEQELPTIVAELWRRIQHYRLGMTLRCVGSLLEVTDSGSTKINFHLMLEKQLRILPISGGSTRGGSGIVRTTIGLFDSKAKISEPMPGEQLRSLITALNPTVLKNRFEVQEKAKYVFETDTEVQAATWVAVLMVSTGQVATSDKQNKAVTAARVERSKSPVRKPAAIESPQQRPDSPALRIERAGSLTSVVPKDNNNNNARALSPPKRAMATLQGLPAAILQRAKSPAAPPSPQQPRSATPPVAPVVRTGSPIVSAPQPQRLEAPKTASPKRPSAPLPTEQPARTALPVIATATTAAAVAPTVETPPTPEAERRKPLGSSFGEMIVSVLNVNLMKMQTFHERLPDGSYRSALLKAILDLEELQFHLSGVTNNLPALIQVITQQLERPEWANMLSVYFTADCPPGFIQANSDEYLLIFRLFSRLQEIVKTDLETTQELRMRKQLLLNQVSALLKGVNAKLPPLQPAGFTRQQVATEQPPSVPATRVQHVQSLWSWSGGGPSELSISQGEILMLKAQASAEWWYVVGAGGEGYVPASYLRMLP